MANSFVTDVEVRRFGGTAVRVATTKMGRSVTDEDIGTLRREYERLLQDASSPLVLCLRDVSDAFETSPPSIKTCTSILTALCDGRWHEYSHLRAVVVRVVVLDDIARAVANVFLGMYSLPTPLHITDNDEEMNAFLEQRIADS